MASGLRVFPAKKVEQHPVDKFLHFFHSVFHTPIHTMIGVSFLSFVSFSFMLASALLTVDYFNAVDFYSLYQTTALN